MGRGGRCGSNLPSEQCHLKMSFRCSAVLTLHANSELVLYRLQSNVRTRRGGSRGLSAPVLRVYCSVLGALPPQALGARPLLKHGLEGGAVFFRTSSTPVSSSVGSGWPGSLQLTLSLAICSALLRQKATRAVRKSNCCNSVSYRKTIAVVLTPAQRFGAQ